MQISSILSHHIENDCNDQKHNKIFFMENIQ